MRRTMSTMSNAVATTKNAVIMKPRSPGVTWSCVIPSRNEGVGWGAGVVARLRSRLCTVNTFYGTGVSREQIQPPEVRALLLRGIEIACRFYLSPANRSFSGSSEGTRELISE